MKKLYAVMAAALLLCGLLTACGSKTETANDVDLTGFYNALAEKYGYAYLDLSGAFTDPDGRLLEQYTYDGLHLNDDAYVVWRRQIDSYVAKASTRK